MTTRQVVNELDVATIGDCPSRAAGWHPVPANWDTCQTDGPESSEDVPTPEMCHSAGLISPRWAVRIPSGNVTDATYPSLITALAGVLRATVRGSWRMACHKGA